MFASENAFRVEHVFLEKDMTDKEIHDRDLEWLASSDGRFARYY